MLDLNNIYRQLIGEMDPLPEESKTVIDHLMEEFYLDNGSEENSKLGDIYGVMHALGFFTEFSTVHLKKGNQTKGKLKFNTQKRTGEPDV